MTKSTNTAVESAADFALASLAPLRNIATALANTLGTDEATALNALSEEIASRNTGRSSARTARDRANAFAAQMERTAGFMPSETFIEALATEFQNAADCDKEYGDTAATENLLDALRFAAVRLASELN